MRIIFQNKYTILWKFAFILVFSLVFLFGCDDDISDEEGLIDNDYTPSSDDVIDRQDEIINLDIFEKFVKNVNEGKQDKIRIVKYTTEGDPILKDLEYDSENIVITKDTTWDQYGDGNITITSCESINESKTKEGKEYVLSGCDNSDENIVLTVR